MLSDELAKRQKEFDANYSKVESEIRYLMNTEKDYEIVRFQHIDALVSQEDVELKVNEICEKTFLGDFVVGKVKIKQNPSGNAFTEIWALKIPKVTCTGSLFLRGPGRTGCSWISTISSLTGHR